MELGFNEKLKIGIFTLIGTTIEYYDFFLFALLSVLVFPRVFFPTSYNPFIATILSLSTYFVTFLARPIGALSFGNLGDREGRRKGLVLNMVLVGTSYIIIGVLPTYNAWGFASILLLLILRFIFGLGMGGEYGGALAILFECSRRKAIWTCFVQSGPALGELLALGGLELIGNPVYNWRILVIGGGIIAIVNFLVRKKVPESPSFSEIYKKGETVDKPVGYVIKRYIKQIIIVSSLVSIGASSATLTATFSLPLMRLNGISFNMGVNYLILGDVFFLLSLLPLGWVNDKVKNKNTLMLVYLVVGSISVIPGIYLLLKGSILLLSIILLKLAGALSWSIYGVLNAMSFPTEVRYTGTGLSYQLGAMYAGGLCPLLCSMFILHREFLGVCCIILGYSILSIAGTLINRRDWNGKLKGNDSLHLEKEKGKII